MALPTASPSATATPTPVVTTAFPPQSLARVAVDAVLLREEPGTDAKVVARIPGGDAVLVTGPPFHREANGYIWRAVLYLAGYDEWPAQPSGQREATYGWVAIGEGATPFLVPEPPVCPTEPITVNVLSATLPATLVECFGSREITVKGSVISGFGGYQPGEFEPYWLAGPFGFAGAVSTATHSFFYYMPSDQSNFRDGQRIEITGHFDDRAASECHIAVGDPQVAEPDALSTMLCQSRFVATDVTKL